MSLIGPGYQPPSPIISQILTALGGLHQPAAQQPNFDMARAMLAHLAANAAPQHVTNPQVAAQDNAPTPTNLGSVAAGLPPMYPGQGATSPYLEALLAHFHQAQQHHPVFRGGQHPFTVHLPYLQP